MLSVRMLRIMVCLKLIAGVAVFQSRLPPETLVAPVRTHFDLHLVHRHCLLPDM